ncbi:MAG: AAA family ATPase [Candidatus Saccharibacteria bacterium]
MGSSYYLPEEAVHLGLLKKYQKLKGQLLEGAASVKELPPDELVPIKHNLHDLIRGFYKPAGWNCMLSYLATEKDDNYGRQIEWEDEDAGRFSRILMRPPSGEKDNRRESDIRSAEYALHDRIPIGILQNIGKGINRCLGLGVITYKREDGIFVVEPVEIPEIDYTEQQEDAADSMSAVSGRHYFSIRTSDADTAEKLLKGESEIEFGGIYQFEADTRVNDIVFLSLGGNNPPWDPGFHAVCTIIKSPYDKGYDNQNKRYFKIKLRIDLKLPRPIKREELVPYRNCYDITFIGPMTRWEPNQANQWVDESKAITLIRSLIDIFPNHEADLTRIMGYEFITRAKQEVEVLVPLRLRYGQKPVVPSASQNSTPKTDWQPDLKALNGGLKLPESLPENFKILINQGMHLMLCGPPGTGKTTAAVNSADEAVKNGFISGRICTTATADWTTFDTIGGYMLNRSGAVTFSEGIVLQSIRNNSWLIIDEINRADIDKAFGQLLTLLSGQAVVLPFIDDSGKPYSIDVSPDPQSSFNEDTATYAVGRNWRIIATMNTYDKNSLYTLSYAFMRRFAFLELPIPGEEDIKHILQKRASYQSAETVLKIYQICPRVLGPAVLCDFAGYLDAAGLDQLTEGITAFILPQLEGISQQESRDFYKNISIKFDLNSSARERLGASLLNLLDLNKQLLNKAEAEVKRQLLAAADSGEEASDENEDGNGYDNLDTESGGDK